MPLPTSCASTAICVIHEIPSRRSECIAPTMERWSSATTRPPDGTSRVATQAMISSFECAEGAYDANVARVSISSLAICGASEERAWRSVGFIEA